MTGAGEGIIPREHQLAQYKDHLSFPTPKENPWNTQFFTDRLTELGASRISIDNGVVEKIKKCYEQEPNNRYYHGPDHAAFVGATDVPRPLTQKLSTEMKPKASALLALAGIFHDAAYKHVDAIDDEGTRAWPPEIREFLGGDNPVAEYKKVEIVRDGKKQKVFKTFLTDNGHQDHVTQMVSGIFGVGEDGIIHNQGGNEFDSALAAAKFLEKQGAKLEDIIAVTTMIAATIPFRESVTRDAGGKIIGDGEMGELAGRVQESLLVHGLASSWSKVDDIMLLAVHMANRDIAPFIQPDNAANIIKGGRLVKKEEVRALREEVTSMNGLVQASSREASSPLLYGWIADQSGTAPVPAANVPSIYLLRGNQMGTTVRDFYPPLNVYDMAVKYTEENCDLANVYFIAHELGIATAAMFANNVGESDALVPGFVHAESWDYKNAIPTGEQVAVLSEGERVVYEALMGKGQMVVDSATPQRSPIAGFLFGTLGREKIEALSADLKTLREQYSGATGNPFENPYIADEWLAKLQETVGNDALRTIVTELHRVAIFFQNGQRAEALKNFSIHHLGGDIKQYTSETHSL